VSVDAPLASPADLGTVLGVWAHPDDEAYLSGGLMAMARDAGRRVVVVTATAGELGSPDPAAQGPRLAAVRRQELAESLAALGVDEHHVIGLPDGGCEHVPIGVGGSLVARWILDVRPDTIVTFGPEGMTGHPDHQAVHRWTRRAWDATGRTARLLYATVTPDFHATWGPVNDRLGLWGGDVPCTEPERLALSVDCRPVLPRKLTALEAHASQIGPVRELVGPRYDEWWAVESFVAAR
jgi:LmbE family N-acetylglucosaminyl deacetylase